MIMNSPSTITRSIRASRVSLGLWCSRVHRSEPPVKTGQIDPGHPQPCHDPDHLVLKAQGLKAFLETDVVEQLEDIGVVEQLEDTGAEINTAHGGLASGTALLRQRRQQWVVDHLGLFT
jgi:hypothetical protein